MAIRLKQTHKCQLGPGFWPLVDTLCLNVGKRITTEIQNAPNELHAKRLSKTYAGIFDNLRELHSRDLVLTPLQRLKFDEITTSDDSFYCIAEKVICKSTNGKRHNYDFGKYQVEIPIEAFEYNPPIGLIEFLPVPYHHKRHPHHYFNEQYKTINTCWGSYASWAREGLRDVNLPFLFSGMYEFLTSYTPGDTLIYPFEVQEEMENL